MTPVAADRTSWLAAHVLPHEPVLRAWLERRAVDGLDPDDIVLETYAVLADLPTVSDIASPRAYAFQTARSVILRHLRSGIERIEVMEELELADAARDESVPPRHDVRRVADLVSSLPAKCREAFRLRKVEGLSQREVAQRLGISESAVEKRMALALSALMGAMKRDANVPAARWIWSRG